eukprot:TRINITY_DN47130_c0_g1_i1.p1 TRINITY_DN47130_c0_g1~~TRINITY_DN47130_c0_g1_i1.p1  ORF type:complete len:425 (+),score=116.84 TRINITY_DN47130_c0_g1_i1:88-1362(+)
MAVPPILNDCGGAVPGPMSLWSPPKATPWYLQAHPQRDPEDRGGSWTSPRPADGELGDWYSDFNYDQMGQDWGKERMRQQADLMARTGGKPQGRTPKDEALGELELPAEAGEEGRYRAPKRDESFYTSESSDGGDAGGPTYMDRLSYDPRIHHWQKQWVEQQSPDRYRQGALGGDPVRPTPEQLRRLAFQQYATMPSQPPSASNSPRHGASGDQMGGVLEADRLVLALSAAGFGNVAATQAMQLAAAVSGPPLSWGQFNSVCDSLVRVRQERAAAFRALQHGVPGSGPRIYGFDLSMALVSAGFVDVDEQQVEHILRVFGISDGARIELRVFDAMCNYLADARVPPRPGSPRAFATETESGAASPVPGSPRWQSGGGAPVPAGKSKAASQSPKGQRNAYEKTMAQKVELPQSVQALLRPAVQSL